jgi:M6 family metalloprotease-like protein
MQWTLLRILVLALCLTGLAPAQSIEQINRTLDAASVVAARPLLAARSQVLIGLMEADPARALRSLLPPRTADRLRAVAPDLVEVEGAWEGPADVAVADHFTARTSQTLIQVHSGAETLRVYFVGALPELACGDSLRIQGVRLGDRVLARSSQLAPNLSTASCSVTTGPQQVLAILVNMPSTKLPSYMTPAYANQYLFGSGSHTLTGYWNEASYGKTTAVGMVAGPVTLAQDFTCDQSSSILTAAIAAADGSINLTNYNRIFVIFPQAGSCSWEGLGSIGCVSLTSPLHGTFTSAYALFVADFLTSTDMGASVSAHEGGHNLKLNHSSTLLFGNEALGAPGDAGTHDEYNDYFSVMGYAWSYNGVVFLGHYSSPHKSALGWFSSGNLQNVTSAGTYNIQPYETPTTGIQALRVLRGSGINQYLWIEYRQLLGNDATFQSQTLAPYQGAWIHFEDPSATKWSGYTHLLDFTPSTNNDFTDADLAPGITWSDPYTTLSLTVNSATPAALNVTVNYDTPCATLGSSSASYPPQPANGTIQVTGSCASSAVSNASWITVTGGNSFTGNGLVSYSVATNTTAVTRTGTISVARQTFTITQSPTDKPTAVSVNPAAGATPAGQFTSSILFTYFDLAGASNLTQVHAIFGAVHGKTGSCWIQYAPATSTLRLYADDGVGSTTTSLGTGTLSNSQCTLNAASSRVAVNGNNVLLAVSVRFNGTYAGAQAVFGEAIDGSGNDSGLVPLGTWTITTDSPTLSIAETHSGTFFAGQLGATYSLVVTNNATSGATGGTVTLTETVPNGMTLTSLSGTGWTCAGTACTRSDTLAAQASYPAVSIVLNVAANAPASLTNQVSVSGGGSVSSSISDVTKIGATLVIPSAMFVQQVYRDLLSRAADTPGLTYWQGQIDSGAASRAQVAAQFFTGPEFTASGYYVIKLYLAVLGRDPDYSGWAFWFNGMQSGAPASTVLASFLSSAEFIGRYGNLSNSAFVTLVYQNVLGRAPDSAGLQYYVGLLNSNQIAQAAVFDQFVRSAEYDSIVRSRAYANLLYMGFLRRSAESSGLQFWQSSLAAGNPLSAAVAAFIGSSEYLSRLAPLVPSS